MKAVNMKNYRFGFGNDPIKWGYTGFGIYDEETNTFVSHDGKEPYVLRTKKLIEGCIAANFDQVFKSRVKPIN